MSAYQRHQPRTVRTGGRVSRAQSLVNAWPNANAVRVDVYGRPRIGPGADRYANQRGTRASAAPRIHKYEKTSRVISTHAASRHQWLRNTHTHTPTLVEYMREERGYSENARATRAAVVVVDGNGNGNGRRWRLAAARSASVGICM